jgi:V8-like Glu-specific endopeptidase
MYNLFFPLSVFAAIFGADSRLSVNSNSPQAELARSTAVAVLSGNFSTNQNGSIELDLSSLEEMFCSEQNFVKDPSMAYACTGFLVGPDLIATAGHCMVNTGESKNETQSYCEAYSWMFDYQKNPSGFTQTKGLPKENLYHCKEIIYAVKEERAPFRDFALVRLDRQVLDRKPLKLATEVSVGEPVTMLGHPLGFPLVYSYDAEVLLSDKNRQSFITNLDAFEGNSGSPVFNTKKEVIGILIGGTPSQSYFENSKGCNQYNVCDQKGENCLNPDPDGGKSFPGFQRIGSEVQRMGALLELLKP